MWKKLKRWSAMMLAAFLVITSVQYTGLIVEAENTTTLTYDSGSSMASVKEGDSGVEFSFDANNQELKFALGQTIDSSKFRTATFNITGLTEGQKLALKLYDAEGNQVGVKYDLDSNFVLTAGDLSSDAAIAAIGIMANMDGASGTAVFGGVDFKMLTDEAPVTVTYTALDGIITLAENYKYGYVSYTGTSDGKLVIESAAAGQKLEMKPASSVSIDNFKSVTFNVSELTGSYTFGLKSWSAEYLATEAQTAAGPLTFDISGNSGEINLIIFDNTSDTGTMTVDSIVFTKNDDSTVLVTMPQNGYTLSSGNATIAGGKLSTSLTGGYGSSTFLKMPATIDPTAWDTMTVDVVSTTAETEIRLASSSDNYGWGDGVKSVKANAAGVQTIDMSTVTGEFDVIRLSASAADNSDVTIGSITLSKVTTATTSFTTFEEVPADQGGNPGGGGEGEVIPPGDMETALVYDSTSSMDSVVTTTGGVEMSFSANNQEAKFALGQTIDSSKFNTATFNITGLTEGQKLALKLYDAEGNQVGVKYELDSNFVLTVDDLSSDAAIAAIGIMANMDGASGTAVFGGVDFKLLTDEEPVTVTYTALDGIITLAENYKYGHVSYTGTSDGKLVIESAAAGQKLEMKPASTVSIDDFKSVTFNVSELTGSYTFGLKSWSAEYLATEAQTAAGPLTFDISGNSGEINLIIFDNTSDTGTMTVDSIVFTKNDDSTVVVTMPQNGYTLSSGNATIAGGKLSTSLTGGYGSSTFLKMPATIDPTAWDTMTVDVVSTTAETEIRLASSSDNYGWGDGVKSVKANAAGVQTIDMSTVTGEFDVIRLSASAADNSDVTIGSITLSKVATATTTFNNFSGVEAGEENPNDPVVPPEEKPEVSGELEVNAGSMNEVTVDSTGATITFDHDTFESMTITLPGEVSTANLESITFHITVISGAENVMLAFKDETGASDTSYGHTNEFVYIPTSGWKSSTISKLGIMTNGNNNGLANKEATVKFSGVTFNYEDGTTLTLDQFAAPKVTTTLAYHFKDIKSAGSRNASSEVDDIGRATLSFGGDSWGYYSFAVPDEIAGMTITNVKVYASEIIEGTPSIVAVKFYDDASANCDDMNAHYDVSWSGGVLAENGYNLADTDKILEKFCFAAGAQQSVKLVVRKIEFTVEGEVDGGSDFRSEVTYNFNDLPVTGGWSQASSVTNKDGKLTMNFAEKYGEVQLAIPEAMAGKKITKMSFNTSIGNAANLAVKLYAGDTEVVTEFGKTSFDVATEEDITKIAFMLNADDTAPIVVDSVTFVIDGDVEDGSEFITEAYDAVPTAAFVPIVKGNATVSPAVVNGGSVDIAFAETNAAVYFAIPDFINMSMIKAINLEDAVSVNGVQVNVYTAADYAAGTPTIIGEGYSVITDGRSDLKYIGFVSTDASANIASTRIVFAGKNMTKDGDMYTWTADNLVVNTEATTATVVPIDDKQVITFASAEDIVVFELPELINLAGTQDICIAISKSDVPLVFYYYDEEMNEIWSTSMPQKGSVHYTHLAAPAPTYLSGNMKYLGVGATEANGDICVLDGLSVNRLITSSAPYVVPEYTVLTYTWEDVLKMETDGWSGSSYEKGTDSVRVNLPGTYGEVSFKLPVKIDLAQCETISVKMKGQTLPVAVKLMKNYDSMVVNYDRTYGTRVFKPYSDAQINKFSLMSLASTAGSYVDFESITFTMYGNYVPEAISTGGIVINGNFDDEDVSDWKAAFWDNVTITTAVSPTPIFDNVSTYGVYSARTSPYQCFAQDITGRVEQDATYSFSFWAKLSDDYKGAPDVQRVVSFSPYTVDTDGVADYNPNLQGVYSQVLNVGEWTKFEGTWKVTNANKIESVFIRILEQGTNYGQGDCVLGSYAITGVKIEEYIPEPPSIDEDVPDLKASLTQEFGDDFIVGTAITGNEFDDIGVEMLANKHFNAITLGNELKPDALMGYSETHTALQTIDFNGQKLVVPTLSFTSADAKLNTIMKWNEDHPESPIKVRGHVLVWHSQTMEWFFRENYVIGQNADGTENYVSPEEMNLRLEWYIKTVLEHFVGENSKYKDLFYGWDVVNEAVSDGTGGYRTNTVTKAEQPSDTRHGSNSSWWALYESNEFIIKAFQYANKYAPAELELYYNDYNETDSRKVKGIVQLLTDVLAAEGTRIDAMGMQGHYNLYNPGMGTLERAIRDYCAVVGKVQITELDLKATDYIGSDSALEREYKAQAEHYKKIHDLLLKLDAEDGIEIAGVTFWGTIDTYSWLQSSSNVGGGSDGSMQHCPLLFDGNYKVKPAYWAWVDYSMVDPDYVSDVTTGGSTAKPDKDVDDKAETDSSESSENVEQSETLSVSVNDDGEKSSGIVPIVVVAACVVAGGAGAGAFLLKRKKKSIGE